MCAMEATATTRAGWPGPVRDGSSCGRSKGDIGALWHAAFIRTGWSRTPPRAPDRIPAHHQIPEAVVARAVGRPLPVRQLASLEEGVVAAAVPLAANVEPAVRVGLAGAVPLAQVAVRRQLAVAVGLHVALPCFGGAFGGRLAGHESAAAARCSVGSEPAAAAKEAGLGLRPQLKAVGRAGGAGQHVELQADLGRLAWRFSALGLSRSAVSRLRTSRASSQVFLFIDALQWSVWVLHGVRSCAPCTPLRMCCCSARR